MFVPSLQYYEIEHELSNTTIWSVEVDEISLIKNKTSLHLWPMTLLKEK